MPYTGSLQVTTPSDREVAIVRVFDAPRTLVFDCMSTPELLKRWLLGPPGWTMSVCEIDFRVGGRYRYEWKNVDGRTMGMGGVYKEIVRPERIVTTELFDDDWTAGEAVNTSTFAEQGGKTTFTLTILYASLQARDGAIKSGMTRGVDHSYNLLADLMKALPIGESE